MPWSGPVQNLKGPDGPVGPQGVLAASSDPYNRVRVGSDGGLYAPATKWYAMLGMGSTQIDIPNTALGWVSISAVPTMQVTIEEPSAVFAIAVCNVVMSSALTSATTDCHTRLADLSGYFNEANPMEPPWTRTWTRSGNPPTLGNFAKSAQTTAFMGEAREGVSIELGFHFRTNQTGFRTQYQRIIAAVMPVSVYEKELGSSPFRGGHIFSVAGEML